MSWPEWWHWELELTPHVEERLIDRDFTEVELRSMLQNARGYRPTIDELRFAVPTRLRGRGWMVVVEPDPSEQLLVVVTAYPVG